jgi:uncharacterized surface protein with fasciclin (FAS1) repeats
MLIQRLSAAAAASALLAAGAAAAQTPAPAAPAAATPPAATPPAAGGDLVATAQAAGQFNTLLKAAEVTGLTPVLKRPNAMTVFAPTDAAFAALPAGELDRLMQPANRQELQQLLLAHIVNTSVPSSTLAGKKGTVPNGAGAQLTVDGTGQTVMVNDAKVVRADVRASNGIIHVVDKVILPGTASATATAATSAAASGANASSVNSTDTDAADPAPAAPAASAPAAAGAATPPTVPPTRN